ncbi:MAG TPA: TIGR01906 family membrane protein [Anaerolineales bacterium]|nr:TIGR01906 family membrane protein [Anaerolineales bacterium]
MPSLLTKILKTLLILLIPVILVPGSARLLATDTYVVFEYGKASFPPDSYGFTSQQRFDLASSNIHYVRAHLPSDALSKQTLNGALVYNSREVLHMADVQAVFQSVLRVWHATFVLLLLMGLILWQKGERQALASAIQSGGLLTLGIILSIALLAAFAWQVWFDNFHLIFFEPGSWLFNYSDTLIRLFPLQFWIDATFTISAFSLAGGLLLAFIGSRWQRAPGKRRA